MTLKSYKCEQCGQPFTGTGKPGRPFRRCPSCRGLRPIILDGGGQLLAIRYSADPGACAVLSVKSSPRSGFHEVKLSPEAVLETVGTLLNVAASRARRKEH